MRLDGEPWNQPLPKDDGKVLVEISHAGQVKMLATKNCIAKGIHEALSMSTVHPESSSSSDDTDDDDDLANLILDQSSNPLPDLLEIPNFQQIWFETLALSA